MKRASLGRGDRPNVLLIVADQMRVPSPGTMPEELAAILGFATEGARDPHAGRLAPFFPGMLALRRHAVVLRQHSIGASACTPSRGVMFTGQYGARTGLTQTSGMAKRGHEPLYPWLAQDGAPTLGDWFRALGYSTHWFGKWHLSEPRGGDLEPWGFADGERSAPEPHGADPRNLGVYRDPRFADDVVSFLRARASRAASSDERPWLAVASLVNPHDISGFPAPWWPGVDPTATLWRPSSLPARWARSLPLSSGRSIALNPRSFPEDCFEPPATLEEDLTAAGKPRCHRESAWKIGLSLRARWPSPARPLCPLPFQRAGSRDEVRAWFRAYGRYYAYFHHLVDREIARIVATLREAGLDERTIVVFTSDHGEHGGAHGGMIHKWHTAYEEVLRVPFVVSSPRLNPHAEAPRTIGAPTSHADLIPTLLSLAGADDARARERLGDAITGHRVEALPGADLRGVIAGEAREVTETNGTTREATWFVTDDEITSPLVGEAPRRWYAAYLREVERAIAAGAPIEPGSVAGAGHVECVRTRDWKLARYWDPTGAEDDEWELYCLARDPEERHVLVRSTKGAPQIATDRAPSTWGLSTEELATVLSDMRRRLAEGRRRFGASNGAIDPVRRG
jgi:arylsulfatase A-like enzyme